MSTELSEPKHFAYLDAVRGYAFLFVLTVHSALCVGDFPLSHLLKCGSFGVQMFFLASAITLCHSMRVRSKAETFPMASFYLRRLFRIAPLFWLAMIFYWMLPGVMPACWLGYWAPDGVHPVYFVLTALFLHGWHPYTFNSIVPGGWSIAVEMTFYLVFPLCFYYINSLKRSAAAIMVAILLTKGEWHLYGFLHTHGFPGTKPDIFSFFFTLWFPSQIGVFLIGIFTYYFLQSAVSKALAESRFWSNFLFLFGLMALPGFLLGGAVTEGVPTQFWVVFTMAAMIIVISAYQVPFIVNPVICYVGQISYSCYLVHFAAIGITLHLLGIDLTAQQTFYETGHASSNLLLFLKIFSISFLLTILIATLTRRLIESPGINLGRRYVKWLNSAKEAQVRPGNG